MRVRLLKDLPGIGKAGQDRAIGTRDAALKLIDAGLAQGLDYTGSLLPVEIKDQDAPATPPAQSTLDRTARLAEIQSAREAARAARAERRDTARAAAEAAEEAEPAPEASETAAVDTREGDRVGSEEGKTTDDVGSASLQDPIPDTGTQPRRRRRSSA